MFGRTAFNTVCWIRWYYGFSLLLDRQFSRAAEQFLILVTESSAKSAVTRQRSWRMMAPPLVTGLAAFFLADTLGKALSDRNDIRSAAETGREQVRNTLKDISAWNKAISATRDEIHLVILLSYLREAGIWLYGDGAVSTAKTIFA
jgi:hypothetical protein